MIIKEVKYQWHLNLIASVCKRHFNASIRCTVSHATISIFIVIRYNEVSVFAPYTSDLVKQEVTVSAFSNVLSTKSVILNPVNFSTIFTKVRSRAFTKFASISTFFNRSLNVLCSIVTLRSLCWFKIRIIVLSTETGLIARTWLGMIKIEHRLEVRVNDSSSLMVENEVFPILVASTFELRIVRSEVGITFEAEQRVLRGAPFTLSTGPDRITTELTSSVCSCVLVDRTLHTRVESGAEHFSSTA